MIEESERCVGLERQSDFEANHVNTVVTGRTDGIDLTLLPLSPIRNKEL